jgi:hypothetical protein
MPIKQASPSARPRTKAVSLSLDPVHREALAQLSRLTGRTPQSLLREGLDFVLTRYVPVEIKARPGAARVTEERRAVPRVPTLTEPVLSPAARAARAVREAYVAQSLAPDDPKAKALTAAAVAAAVRHGFVVTKKRLRR